MGTHLFRSFNRKEAEPKVEPKIEKKAESKTEVKAPVKTEAKASTEKKPRMGGVVGGPFTDKQKALDCKNANPGSIIKEKEGFKKKNGVPTTEKLTRYTVMMK